MRAYYLDEDTASNRTLPNDSGQPVSEETLGTLKAKFWTLNGSDAERKASLKQLGERNGFVGDNSQEYEFDVSKDGLPGMPDAPAHGKMDHFSRDSLLLMDIVVCLRSGGVFFDFREPNTNRLIRVSLTEGDTFFFPAGTVFHAHVNETIDSHLTAYAMYKSSKPFSQQLPFAWDQVHDKHPVRAAYIKDLGPILSFVADTWSYPGVLRTSKIFAVADDIVGYILPGKDIIDIEDPLGGDDYIVVHRCQVLAAEDFLLFPGGLIRQIYL
uniref:Putative 1,2-dihydroxy-3-keto-5-methylthiopentene dioxygenase n=1 Tax=Moniliophthora roreri TaxID=221103 RepID=A0A0W0F7V6_MONRR